MRNWTPALLAAALLTLSPAPLFAHKMNVFASAEGKTIRGKAYFSGGGPARNVTVTAYDPLGEEIGKTTTDNEGRFTLEARFHCDYQLLAETGDGHGGQYILAALALPTDLPNKGAASPASVFPATSKPQPTVAVSADQLAGLRAEIVRLEEQLNAHENHIRMTDILGGIGYIAGISGAAYYYFGVRRKKQQ